MKILFLFTVDVESRTHGSPASDILGVLPNREECFGIERIMDLLESQQVRATFFLNAYEVAKHGEDVIADAARLIHARGHDLELHTHPLPMYRYYGMSKAPFEEQVAILKKGIALIESWTGKKVIAHRAGAFSANADTLRACDQIGLLIDSSLSSGSRVSVPLVRNLGVSNTVRRVGNLWEIPVTYYLQFRFGRWRPRRILDIEACSLAEIKCVTQWAVRQKLPTVCLLMHSFSLSRYGRPNIRVIKRLIMLLEWLKAQESIEINTLEQACRRLANDPPIPVVLPPPVTGIWLTWKRALFSWNDGWKNRLIVMTSLTGLIVLVIVLGYLSHIILGR